MAGTDRTGRARRTRRPTAVEAPEARGRPNDERAEQILAAACRAIVRHGFGETRIADIAREAGVSTGTVHYYFETRDDVLIAALTWANEQPNHRLAQALDEAAEAKTKLARLLELSVPYPGELYEDYVLWIELWTRALHEPDLLPATDKLSQRWRSYFFETIREGVESGEFRPVAPPDEVAERLIGLVDGIGFQAALRHLGMEPERMRELLFQFAAEQLSVPYEELERLSVRK